MLKQNVGHVRIRTSTNKLKVTQEIKQLTLNTCTAKKLTKLHIFSYSVLTKAILEYIFHLVE